MKNDGVLDLESLRRIYSELRAAKTGPGRVSRRVLQKMTARAIVFVDTNSGFSGLELEFRDQKQPFGQVEQAKGLDVILFQRGESQVLSISQTRPGDDDLFVVVVADILTSLAASPGGEARTSVNRIGKWRAFFSRKTVGLNKDQQLGLFGELHTLEELARKGATFQVVEAWRGPQSEVHDFSANFWSLEVKSTRVLGSSLARVNSELQLDSSVVDALYLAFLAFDVRPEGTGLTLPGLVSTIRGALVGATTWSSQFEDRLIDAGYHDIHRGLYRSTYQLIRAEMFTVTDQFPSITRSDLPDAISHTTYQLNVDRCQEWRVSTEEIIDTVIAGISNEY